MNLENIQKRALGSWATVGVLAALCLVLAGLQYKWIGEISIAERERLQASLQSSLGRLSQDFNGELSAAVAALRPPAEAIETAGREEAYAAQWLRWREGAANPALLKRAALAVPEGGTLRLLLFNDAEEAFRPGDWPKGWEGLREGLTQRLRESRPGPPMFGGPMLLEIPRFGGRGGAMGESEWLILELDGDYIRNTYLPALLARHVGTGLPLHARVFDRFDRSVTIFESGPTGDGKAEASVGLLDVIRFAGFGMRGGGGPAFQRGREKKGPMPTRRPGGGGGPPPPPDGARGRWQLDVRYADGSLDAIVARIRWRNLAISAGILGLMLATAVLLVRFSREQHKLAEMQMNFVAGVSHELRTPLTVIRTAAYNLRGRVAGNPAQVERYGTLIQDEAEKLTALVEQVLRFSRARAGHAVGEKAAVAVEGVIDEALHSRRLGEGHSPIAVDKVFEPGLPLVMADEMALKHAVQNLLDNAVKYGTENSPWIGVAAKRGPGEMVEIRVTDRGPGIPPEEQKEIFEPFVRGKRAQQDQIHGTGLGLNLVKKIVEAHGGQIRVESAPGQGTAFIMEIPAAPAELQDEFAHTAG
jgi:signal transduction histidine kinase